MRHPGLPGARDFTAARVQPRGGLLGDRRAAVRDDDGVPALPRADAQRLVPAHHRRAHAFVPAAIRRGRRGSGQASVEAERGREDRGGRGGYPEDPSASLLQGVQLDERAGAVAGDDAAGCGARRGQGTGGCQGAGQS